MLVALLRVQEGPNLNRLILKQLFNVVILNLFINSSAYAGFTIIKAVVPVEEKDEPAVVSSPRTCTVPEGLSENCTKAFQADCSEILLCQGNSECIANRPRQNLTSCDRVKAIVDKGGDIDPMPSQSNSKPPAARSSNTNAEESTASTTTQEQLDPQPCMTALSNARRACDTSQASSFGNQVSGGSQGLTGAAVATTGTQNVNNILVNCSNSQQICASACSVAQLPEVQSECQRLESNLKYLAQSADTSFDNASNELTHFPSSSPYALGKNQNGNVHDNRDTSLPQERSREKLDQNLKPNQLDLSPAESPTSPSTYTENLPTTNDINTGGTLPSTQAAQDDYTFETSLGIPKPYAPGIAGALINGKPTTNANGSSGAPQPNSATTAQAQKATADLTASLGGGGYSQPQHGANDETEEYNSYSQIQKTQNFKKGFSLFANWRSSIRAFYEDLMREPAGTKERNPATSERGRLGIDSQLAMEPLPDAPRTHLPEVAFGATILSLFAIGIWRFKTLLALKGALKAAQLADQAQRRLHQRRTNDRRVQSSLFREGEAERRKSSGDRRDRQRTERRSASRAD